VNTETEGHRIIALKVDIDWRNAESKKLYKRLRDLSWQSARYRNYHAMALYAREQGWRQEDSEDRNAIIKLIRKNEKQELSGAAYSAAEREVDAAYSRDSRRIYSGQPIPQWRPAASLSVRGHRNKNESGVRLEVEGGRYVAYLQAQSKECEDGSWLRLPIAQNTRRDEYQKPVLDAMVQWTTAIDKAFIQIKPHAVVLRLSYKLNYSLSPMGQRKATLGPLVGERLLLRTEAATQTKDYSSQIANIRSKKDAWDQIRRRALAQIGWRHGQARMKRERLAHLSWDDWLLTYLQTWTRNVAAWCHSQGVGEISIASIADGDWPADKFVKLLRYKAAALGMKVNEAADVTERSGERAAQAVVRKHQTAVKKRRQAERQLQHQLKA